MSAPDIYISREWVQWLAILKKAVETPRDIAPEQVPSLPYTHILMDGGYLLGRTSAGNGVAQQITVSAPLALANGALTLSGLPSAYVVGDLLYANSATTLTRLSDVAVGSYLRSGGVATAPLWSTLKLPNAANSGDIFKASGANTYASVAPAALTKADDTNVTLTLGGTPASALVNAASLTLGWTGTLAVSRGGTNIASYAVGDLLYASGATTLSKLADVAAGSYLRSGGVTTAPVWSTLTLPNSAATGDLLYASGANTMALRTIGSSGEVLAVSGGVPTWSATSGLGTGDLTKTDDTNVTLTLGGTPVGSLFKSVSLAMGWTGTLGVARGGTGTGTAFTAGSVIFAGASGVYAQNNANFFWDDANTRLGIGTAAPATGVLHVNRNALGGAVASSLLPGGMVQLLTNGSASGSGTIAGVVASSTIAHLPGLYLRSIRARGTYTTPTVVQTDDLLSLWESESFDGSGRAATANIGMFVDSVSGSDVKGYITFLTTRTAAKGPEERLRVTNDSLRQTGFLTVGRKSTLDYATVTEAVTLSGGTSSTTTMIPAGATAVEITTSVETAITGATGYQVGDGSDADRYGDITGTSTSTISGSANYTADPGWFGTSARSITLTAKTSNFTGGSVQVTAYYRTSLVR